ncbi:MAG: 3-isopropylmalate dehydrogenase [Clostridia bacterium]|nr:3-isopropylmalate dehydrogenase [Clostridia bacterium]
MNKKIALIKGDGIGPEIVESAVRVLDRIAEKYNHKFTYVDAPMGGNAIDVFGEPLPQSSIDTCLKSDAVLLGAVGGHKWDNLSGKMRPEAGLLGIRKALKVYANLRPAKLYPQLKERSPLKNEISEKGFDILIVRELTGGIYFGERGIRSGSLGREAYDTECYSEIEIERIARVAFEMAEKRNKKVTSIDKANVLESSRLWRKIVHDIAQDYPNIFVEDMLVDNAAMQLAKNPGQFDVILTSNMFGDILSDLASALTGSIGLLPSSSLGDSTLGLYEPIHGSAPDLPRNVANPIGTILSAAMMLSDSFNMPQEAKDIQDAVEKTLNNNYRTADIYMDGYIKCSTKEITDKIIEFI